MCISDMMDEKKLEQDLMDKSWNVVLSSIFNTQIGESIKPETLRIKCLKFHKDTYVHYCITTFKEYGVLNKNFIKLKNIKNTWTRQELEKYKKEQWKTWFMKLD